MFDEVVLKENKKMNIFYHKKKISIFLFILCFFILGYFRNYVFLSVNNRASALYYNEPTFVLSGFLSTFNKYSYNDLITVKWVLTLLFTLLFTFLSLATVYTIFRTRTYNYLCLGLNIFIFIISIFFILSGKIFSSFSNNGFVISRSLTHLEQSPIITFIIVMAVYYQRRLRY